MRFKYDRRSKKRYFVAACILSPLCLILFPSLFATISMDRSKLELATYAFLLLIFLAPVTLACWAAYADSLLYIRRLEKWGITVPYIKGEQLIPPPSVSILPGEGPVCRESVILSSIAFSVCAGIVIWALLHILHFILLGDGGDGCFTAAIFGIPLILAWLCGGFVYYHQRLNSLYRDIADPLPYKKVRTRFVNGILTILIGLGITVALLNWAHNMADYSYRSRLESVYGDDWRIHIGERLP